MRLLAPLAFAFALVLVPACHEEPAGLREAGVDATTDLTIAPHDAGAGRDLGVDACRWDCYAESHCDPDSGIVRQSAGDYVACQPGRGSDVCIVATYTCPTGCRRDGVLDLYGAAWRELTLLCEDGRPRVVGDLCTTDVDCTPFEGDARLACDADAGTCAAYSVPVPAGFEAPCCPPAGLFEWPGNLIVDDPSCAGGVCLAKYGPSGTAGACVVRCDDDWDCPDGHRCADHPAPDGGTTSVCDGVGPTPCADAGT